MEETAQPRLTFLPEDDCLVSLMRQGCVCAPVHVFVSLFAENREVTLDEINFAESTGETLSCVLLLLRKYYQLSCGGYSV